MANDLPTPAPNLEKFAAKAAGMDIETPTPVTNMEKYLDAIAKGGGGTSDYTDLTNKPQINGVTLSGNKTASDIGCASLVDGKVPASELPSTDTATQSSTDLITSGGVYTIVGNINTVLEEVL